MTDPARWLWLSAELPVELSTGLLVYSHRLVEGVRQAGVDVTLVGSTSGRTDVRSYWRAVDEPLRGGWRSLTSTLPNLSYAASGPQLRGVVEAELARPWDAIVIDHLQMAWAAAEIPAASRARVVYVTHNHEGGVRRRVAAETPWGLRKAALALDAWKAQRLERRTVDRADVVTTITEADRAAFMAADPTKRFVVLPPGWSGSRPSSVVPIGDRPRRVGVMGSFDWHVKQENLRRFVAAAADVFPVRGIEFVVAGSIPASFRDELAETHPWVQIVGWVDDPDDFLGSLRMGVVAEPIGGGFKLKSLDYVFHQTPVAALRGSLAGIPLLADESMVEAPTVDSLAAEIGARIDDDAALDRLAAAALEACADRFDWQDRADALVAAVASVPERAS